MKNYMLAYSAFALIAGFMMLPASAQAITGAGGGADEALAVVLDIDSDDISAVTQPRGKKVPCILPGGNTTNVPGALNNFCSSHPNSKRAVCYEGTSNLTFHSCTCWTNKQTHARECKPGTIH